MRAVAVALLAAVVPLAGAAAPVPKETPGERLRRLYGKPEDPLGDCTFALDGPRLKLTAGKGLRGLNPRAGLNTAPRTLKPVCGDFTATVRVVSDPPPIGAGRSSDEYTVSGGGGLLLWVDEHTHLRLSRSQYLPGGGRETSYNLRGVSAGNQLPDQMHERAKSDAKPVTLRLVRAGNKVSGAYRPDGEGWVSFEPVTVELPPTVAVGVYVAHNFDRPMDVTFEPVVVTPTEGTK